jgi:hypothetical protein
LPTDKFPILECGKSVGRSFSAKNISRSPAGSAFIELKRSVNEMRMVGVVTLT